MARSRDSRSRISSVPARAACCLIVSVLAQGSSARAQTETFTWQEAVAEARAHHPDLVSARERVRQSEADRTIAQSALFPQVSADVDASRSRSGSSARSDSYAYGVSGRQLIFDGFGTYADFEQAVLGTRSEEYDYRVTSSDVRVALRTAFVNLLRAQESLEIARNIADRRRRSRDLIRLRYEGGREHKGSLLTSEANLAQADFEVEQALRGITLAQRRLLVQLGRSRFVEVRARGDLDTGGLDRTKPDLEGLAETTPLLRRLILLKEAARWGVRSARAAFFPQVYAAASTGRSSSSWPPDRTEWSLGASLSVPVFEGGANVAGLAKASATLAAAETDETGGRHGVILTLEQTWKAYADSLDNVGVQKLFLDAALERATIAESEYSTGLLTFNNWIIIEDNLVRAQKTHLDARAEALLAEATWRQAKGETLDEA